MISPVSQTGERQMIPFDLNLFAERLQQTARALLRGGANQPLGEVARAVQELAEVTLARHQVNPQSIGCHAGCGHCCIVNVAVLGPEVDAIIEHLQRTRSQEQQQQLADRAEAQYHQIRGLDDEERIMSRCSCLFLDTSSCCDIYPVRPLLCRALTSTDPDRCREAIAMVALGDDVQILANIFQQELFNRAFTGLAAVLEELGLEGRSQKLTAAIRERLVQLA